MTLSPTERKIVVSLELEKANNIFSQIEVLQNAGFWDNIANRLYYSLFHAVSVVHRDRYVGSLDYCELLERTSTDTKPD